MSPILKKKIRSVWLRLQWIAFCRRALLVLGCAGIVLALWILLARLTPLPMGPEPALPWMAGAAALWIAAWVWLRRVRLIEAASQADQTLNLKERLSTALMIGTPRNEAEQAVMEDAEVHAKAVRPARAFPMRLGRETAFAVTPLALFLALWLWMPTYDLFAALKKEAPLAQPQAVRVEAQKQAAQSLQEMAAEMAKTEDLLPTTNTMKLSREFDKIAEDLLKQRLTPEEAMNKMAKAQDKIEARKQEIEKKLEMPSNLQERGEGKLTGEIAKELEKGNFEKAAQAVQQLKEKLQKKELSEEEKKALGKELQKLAQKLGGESELGKQLAEAGQKIDADKFNEALSGMENAEQAMKQMEGMLAELKNLQSSDAAEAAKRLASACKGGSCASCGKKCGEGKGECNGGNCVGKWKAGESRAQGRGMGGQGIGQGGPANREEGAVGFKSQRIKGDLQPGQIVAKFKVPGEQTPGEMTTAYESMRIEYQQQAEETIAHDPIPLEHRELVREYYDAIKQGAPADAPK